MRRLSFIFLLCSALSTAQRDIPPGSLNKPDRLEWFRDQGFGLFIHWSVDSQTGVVFSFTVAGADEAYTRRFFEDLPKTFNPRKFEPRDWAALACAMAFMLAAFGQIPINDFMIGRMAQGDMRARIYGVRYVVSFTVLAAALPLIAFVYERWGFDTLFQVLSVAAMLILAAVTQLPRRLPAPAG
jgi:hypothetical protein